MTIISEGILRLSATGIMLLSAAVGGFLWAQNLTSKADIIAAAVATTLSLVMALFVDGIAVRSATKLDLLRILLVKADQNDHISVDKAKGLDLIVAMLTEENSNLRTTLLTDKVRAMDAIRRSESDDE